MSNTKDRRRRFKAALALTDQTMSAWAAANGVVYGHLYQVLNNTHESQVLSEKIDSFIASVEKKSQRRASAA